MTVDELFEHVSQRFLAEEADVEQGRMFSAVGLKTAGKFFAFARRGELVVKLPAERVDELVAGGKGHRFDPGHGRLMREWATLQPGDEAACAAYVGEARDFVAAQAKGA